MPGLDSKRPGDIGRFGRERSVAIEQAGQCQQSEAPSCALQEITPVADGINPAARKTHLVVHLEASIYEHELI
jgi:hypothetical protein